MKGTVFALKGRDNSAQGNALGTGREPENTSSPKEEDRFQLVGKGKRLASILEPRALPWADLFGPYRARPTGNQGDGTRKLCREDGDDNLPTFNTPV